MRRVEVAKGVHGIAYMIACCEKDCTNEEILTECENLNPSGTRNGWSYVFREDHERENQRPVQCQENKDRLHFIVGC